MHFMLNLFVCSDIRTRKMTNKGRERRELPGEKPDSDYLAQICFILSEEKSMDSFYGFRVGMVKKQHLDWRAL